MRQLLSFCLILLCMHVTAQKKQQVKSYLMPQVGILNGDHAISLQFQVVGGIKKNNWLLGVGAGIDRYKLRSVPLFVDARHFLGKKKRIFALLNIGYNIPWPKEDQYKIYYGEGRSEKSKFDMGIYTDAGVGYSIPVGKKQMVSLSLGYSIKKFAEHYNSNYNWTRGGVVPRPVSDIEERKLDYTFRRLSFKAGFHLW